MNARELIHNCEAHGPEELAPLEGEYLAWSPDGKTLLAHAKTLAELFTEVNRLGIKDYVLDTVPPAEESCLGGAGL
jgi:hypothetical protein